MASSSPPDASGVEDVVRPVEAVPLQSPRKDAVNLGLELLQAVPVPQHKFLVLEHTRLHVAALEESQIRVPVS